ncbi:AI-2E family transporter [Kitasatospora sp. NPDC094015]|uniref:AI-2E family transporter n=1 Tax=Kitasatospora sp. NPDC094015 TaxID=3155205 RepID=UPI00331828C1
MTAPARWKLITRAAAGGVRRQLLVPDPTGTAGPADGGTRAAGPPAPRAPQSPPSGRPWFSIGLRLSLGALLGWLIFEQLVRLADLLTLGLLALFIAVSLDPVVVALTRRRLRRGWAVAVVLAGFVALAAGFLALVIPPVGREVTVLVDAVPGWLQQLHDHQSTLGRIEDHYHLVARAREQLGGDTAPGMVFGAGRLLLGTVTSLVVVVTLTLYLMAGLPAITSFCYRFVPASRRADARRLTEEILGRTGRYMLGNLVTSAIAGAATFVWCAAVGVPYAAALGVFVALMDLVPMVGSTIAGIVVSLVALTLSWPIAAATAAFYIGFRLLEDYLIMPRAMTYAVDVHPFVTIVAVLVGGAVLGIVGALVAVPAAVAVGLTLDEFVFPRLDDR